MTDRSRAAVAFLALAASLTSLGNGFAFDDGYIVLLNPRVHDASNALHVFGQSYWPPQAGGGLYRPLAILGFVTQWAIGGGRPLVFHAVNVLAYVGVSLAVLALARRVLESRAAFVAAALFAVHPVHVEVVGNVVGQAELWAALALVLAAERYLAWRARTLAGERAPGIAIAVVVLYTLACLSKEHGIVFPALALAGELTVVPRLRGPMPPWRPRLARLARLAPLYAALAATGVAILAVRARVVGGLVDDAPFITFGDGSTATRLWTMLGVSGEWLRLFLWPARLAVIYSPPGIAEHRTFAPELIAPLLALLALVALAGWAWRARPALAFGLAWTAVALLPTSNLLFPSGLLLAERSLFAPSVGVAIALGDGAAWVMNRLETASAGIRRLAAAAFAIVIALGAVRSAARQPVWRDDLTLFAQAVEDDPLSYRAQSLYGGLLLATGRMAEGERRLRLAARLMPRDSDIPTRLATAYREAGLCGPAIPLYEEAERISPRRTDARMGHVQCLLAVARFDEARAAADDALRLGRQRQEFERLRAVADSALAARSLVGTTP